MPPEEFRIEISLWEMVEEIMKSPFLAEPGVQYLVTQPDAEGIDPPVVYCNVEPSTIPECIVY